MRAYRTWFFAAGARVKLMCNEDPSCDECKTSHEYIAKTTAHCRNTFKEIYQSAQEDELRSLDLLLERVEGGSKMIQDACPFGYDKK